MTSDRAQRQLPGTSPRQIDLEDVRPLEPVDENDVVQVLVSSTGNGRSCYHKQHPHNQRTPLCGRVLGSEASDWVFKPKVSISRTLEPCSECYPVSSGGKTE